MKIIYIGTKNHPILEALLDSNHEVSGIAESTVSKNSSGLKSTLFDTYDLLQSLRGKSVKQLSSQAKKKKIPFISFLKNEQAKLADWVSKLQPDLIVVHGMYHLLKKDVFCIPRHGTINYHPSLLPNYPGPNPDFWVYYNMDLRPGGTVHMINAGEDTGDIICAESFPLKIGTPHNEYRSKYYDLGVKLVMDSLKKIESETVQLKKQDHSFNNITRARKINKSEHESFIDWQNWPTERVFHFLRGTLSYIKSIPLPETSGRGHYWYVDSFSKEKTQYTAGTLKKSGKKYLLYCKDGVITMELKTSLSKAVKSLFIW